VNSRAQAGRVSIKRWGATRATNKHFDASDELTDALAGEAKPRPLSVVDYSPRNPLGRPVLITGIDDA